MSWYDSYNSHDHDQNWDYEYNITYYHKLLPTYSKAMDLLSCLIHQIFTEYNMYVSIDLSSSDSTVRKTDKSQCPFFEIYSLGEEGR